MLGCVGARGVRTKSRRLLGCIPAHGSDNKGGRKAFLCRRLQALTKSVLFLSLCWWFIDPCGEIVWPVSSSVLRSQVRVSHSATGDSQLPSCLREELNSSCSYCCSYASVHQWHWNYDLKKNMAVMWNGGQQLGPVERKWKKKINFIELAREEWRDCTNWWKKETPANSNNIISHMLLVFWVEQAFGVLKAVRSRSSCTRWCTCCTLSF